MLEKLRIQLATIDALPQLALMGVISGVLAGSVIILFRILTESVQASYLPQGEAVPAEARSLGIVHVIERLDYHQGHLPLRNAVLQFLGAAISTLCRSRRALGAASGSLLGRGSSSLCALYLWGINAAEY